MTLLCGFLLPLSLSAVIFNLSFLHLTDLCPCSNFCRFRNQTSKTVREVCKIQVLSKKALYFGHSKAFCIYLSDSQPCSWQAKLLGSWALNEWMKAQKTPIKRSLDTQHYVEQINATTNTCMLTRENIWQREVRQVSWRNSAMRRHVLARNGTTDPIALIRTTGRKDVPGKVQT